METVIRRGKDKFYNRTTLKDNVKIMTQARLPENRHLSCTDVSECAHRLYDFLLPSTPGLMNQRYVV